jgi:hypothetical protein
MTQNERVMAYLKEFKTITPLDALRDLGCMRLGARVWELQKQGVRIVSEMIPVKNRWGETVRIAQYRLNEEANGQGVLL